ncbi:hypothetical protein PFTANZ_06460, partial [Plasmodium falciparum Tanzania (2000708)]
MRSDGIGACAPYRRLHLCRHNLETINNTTSTTHKLLAEVCYAAKYEGQSLITYHDKHQLTNKDSQLCTELARSFADIGDIVRGKDLYRGNNKRDKLEKQLQKYFNNIYENLVREKSQAKDYYQDENGGNFFKLREDWWTANRHTVWKAMTCSDDDNKLAGAHYFRATCDINNEKGPSVAKDHCRCGDGDKPKSAKDGDVNIVPTYFDYVPQYLRWFEEWAEDFCRKKNKKIKDVKRNCRGQHKYGNERYCSRNGFDCERTIYKKGYFVIDKGCINCLYACNPYVEWIDKKKEEFEKQKKKYDEEMQKYENGASSSSGGRAKRAAPSNINYEGYEKKFYDKLKGEYSDVNKFLEKLSNED